MATQTSQQTQITDIPEWMKKYMSTSDKNYSGILDEAMRGYRARSGSMTDEQLRNLKMPTRSVAGRTALQDQADTLATSGVGSYMPMLQAGAYTVGSGVQGVGRAQQMIGDAYTGATPYRDFATQQMRDAITNSQTAGTSGAQGILRTAQGARDVGQYGMGASQAGIAGLQGSAAEFDPNSIQKYMNPYESSVIDAAMADVARAGQQQQNQLGAGAVGAGAFGGSRQGIAQGEIARNTLDQQAKTAAGMRQSGYESASNRAQNAYEQARQRQQSAAGMTSQIGQAGAATGLNATQLGMQGSQQAGAMGLQTANQMGQLGQNVGNLGYQYGNMGMNAANQYGAMAQGLGSMGMQQAQLGEAQQGLRMNDYNMLSRIGQQQQGLNQAQLDAQYQNQYQQYQQPMQDLGFYSDVYQGMPIGQSSYTQTSAPGPSAVSQIGGLAGGLYGMYRANQ